MGSVTGPLHCSVINDTALQLIPNTNTRYFQSNKELRRYSNCTSLDYLYIRSGVTTLLSLENLTSISSHAVSGYSITISDCPSLVSVAGLHNVTGRLSGGVYIGNNAKLTSLSSLAGLYGDMGGYLTVVGNPMLDDLKGLNNVTSWTHLSVYDLNNDRRRTCTSANGHSWSSCLQ